MAVLVFWRVELRPELGESERLFFFCFGNWFKGICFFDARGHSRSYVESKGVIFEMM